MMRRRLTMFLRVLLSILLLPGAIWPALADLPEATPAVGYRSISITSPVRGGEVPVGVWYPVPGDGGVGTLVGGSRVFEPTPARTGALPQGRHPLLVMAHGGLRSGRHVGDWLAAGLARSGYVVALVEPAAFEPSGTGVLRELASRPADMSAAISALLGSTELSSMIDPGRIGAVGLLRGGTSVMTSEGLAAAGPSLSVLLLDKAAIPGAEAVDLVGILPSDRLRSVAGTTTFSLFPVCAAQAVELLREDGEEDSLCREEAGRNRHVIHRDLTDLIIGALSDLGLAPMKAAPR